MRKVLKFGALCAAFTLAAGGAQAAVIASLTFDDPTGIVLPTESIPVWLTLTLSADSDALVTDAFGQVTSGLSDAEISASSVHFDPDPNDPNDDYDEYAVPSEVTQRGVNNSFECSGTFVSGCGPGAYAFDFNFSAPSFVGAAGLNLLPGSSTHFLFGTFNPVGGSAPAGTYTFYNANFIFQFLDPARDPQVVFSSNIASTCPGQNDACAFTRTVLRDPGGTVLPEPATWGLMLLGFGTVGAMLRNGRRREALARV